MRARRNVLIVAGLCVALGATAVVAWGQVRVNQGAGLDANPRANLNRGYDGRVLDANPQLGGGGYNVSSAMTRSTYSVNRGGGGGGGGGGARMEGNRSRATRMPGMSRNTYGVPMGSQSLNEAMVRTGHNPATNMPNKGQGAYKSPPLYKGGKRTGY